MKNFNYYIICMLFTGVLLQAEEPAWFKQLKSGRSAGTYQNNRMGHDINSSQPIPTGTYQGNCRDIYLDKEGTLHATCLENWWGKEIWNPRVLKNGAQCSGENIDIESRPGGLHCTFKYAHELGINKDPANFGFKGIIDPAAAQTAQQKYLKMLEGNELNEKLVVAVMNGDLNFIKSVGDKDPQRLKAELQNNLSSSSDIYLYDVAKYFGKENIVTYLEKIKVNDLGYSSMGLERFNEKYLAYSYSHFTKRSLLERVCILTELFMIIQDDQTDCRTITKTYDELTGNFAKDSAVSKPLIDLVTLCKEKACGK